MNKTRILLLVFFTILCAAPRSHAQLNRLSHGDLIRLTGTKHFPRPAIATFGKLQNDSLFFSIHNQTFAIPVDHLRKLERSTGQKRQTVTGMITGSIAGGLLLGMAMRSEGQQSEGFGKAGQPGFWGGFASGALIGGGMGAFIGHHIKSDVWVQINIGEK